MNYDKLTEETKEELEQLNISEKHIDDILTAIYSLVDGNEYIIGILIDKLLECHTDATNYECALIRKGFTKKDINYLTMQYARSKK